MDTQIVELTEEDLAVVGGGTTPCLDPYPGPLVVVFE